MGSGARGVWTWVGVALVGFTCHHRAIQTPQRPDPPILPTPPSKPGVAHTTHGPRRPLFNHSPPLCQPTHLEACRVVGAVQCRGAPRPGAEAAHGHRVGAGGRAPGHGGAAAATRAERHSPCASQPPRGWRCGAVQCRGAPRPGAEAAHGHRVGSAQLDQAEAHSRVSITHYTLDIRAFFKNLEVQRARPVTRGRVPDTTEWGASRVVRGASRVVRARALDTLDTSPGAVVSPA